MTRYESILFDLDGTLIDSGPGIANCTRHALEQMGMDPALAEPIRRFIGPSLMESFMNFCGFDRETAARAVRLYRERYTDVGLFEMEVYPGVPEMLACLREDGRRLVLATLKPEPFTWRILDRLGMSELFECVVGSCLDGRRNTKGEVVAEAAAALGDVPRASIVMAGDHPRDILAAREHGIDAIAVTYGFGYEDELAAAGPVALAASVAELETLLCAGSPRCLGAARDGRPC